MKIDRVHFYVEDAAVSRDWFVRKLGFHPIAEISCNHTCSYVVRSGAVCFVLSSPLTSASPVTKFLKLHPSGVADIGFRVSDLEGAIARAVKGGAKILQPIQKQETVKWGKIAGWGGLVHTLIESSDDRASIVGDRCFTIESSNNPNQELFTKIDHLVLNVAAGDLDSAVSWYKNTLGLQAQQRFDIETSRSGLRSQVMWHASGGVQFPINEPTCASSQIQEFLDCNRGPGIQHIALRTANIVRAIARLRSSGVSFLNVPQTYYTQLQPRHPEKYLSPSEWQAIVAQQVLVDWQEDDEPNGLLLQTFTQPIFAQPTFFFELIERRLQAKGFGEGNFRALFEAIEREQIKRGHL